ncbi:MAG: MBL fold metallo-hydrolase [Pseudomonadota bacterium]
MSAEQYVCPVCGYNMIGECPESCPFCGAGRECFLTSAECSRRYHVEEYPVTGRIARLATLPKLGLEHAAFRLVTKERMIMIDCPVCFDENITRVDTIVFTHPHFLGASNLYRARFRAEAWIHAEDAKNSLARSFPFDTKFHGDFTEFGLEAYHIAGHTPGFTVYLGARALFVCDLVFLENGIMRFNPHGPEGETRNAGRRLLQIVENRRLDWVCGWNYVAEYRSWYDKLVELAGA